MWKQNASFKFAYIKVGLECCRLCNCSIGWLPEILCSQKFRSGTTLFFSSTAIEVTHMNVNSVYTSVSMRSQSRLNRSNFVAWLHRPYNRLRRSRWNINIKNLKNINSIGSKPNKFIIILIYTLSTNAHGFVSIIDKSRKSKILLQLLTGCTKF